MKGLHRKYRQCPHCGGKSGFEITTWLGGYEEKKLSFQGKVLSHERHGADDVDKRATCIDCRESIDTEFLDTKNV